MDVAVEQQPSSIQRVAILLWCTMYIRLTSRLSLCMCVAGHGLWFTLTCLNTFTTCGLSSPVFMSYFIFYFFLLNLISLIFLCPDLPWFNSHLWKSAASQPSSHCTHLIECVKYTFLSYTPFFACIVCFQNGFFHHSRFGSSHCVLLQWVIVSDWWINLLHILTILKRHFTQKNGRSENLQKHLLIYR